MKAAEFLDLVEAIEAWEAVDAPPDYTELQQSPFYRVIDDQRLTGAVWKLREQPKPTHRARLWGNIRYRLAEQVARGRPHTGADGRPSAGEWTVEIPALSPLGWLSANKRPAHHKVAAAQRAQWRVHAFAHAQRHKRLLPRGMAYAKVELHFQVKTYARRDTVNLNDTAKPIIDAFGPPRTYVRKTGAVHEPGLGVFAGDDPAHMAGPFLYLADEEYTGLLDGIVWMRIIDLSPRRSPAQAV